MKGCHNSANGKALYFRTLSSSSGFFVYYCLSNFLSPSLKEFFHWGRGLWQVEQWQSACQCRRCKRRGFNPRVKKIPWNRKWHHTPKFLPGKFHGQRSLADHSQWDCKEPDTTEHSEQCHSCKPGFAILCWSWIKPFFGRRTNWQSIYFR